MKAIHNKVNIVPVIAKADTLTLKERERLKKRVRAGHPCLLSMTTNQLRKEEEGRLQLSCQRQDYRVHFPCVLEFKVYSVFGEFLFVLVFTFHSHRRIKFVEFKFFFLDKISLVE